MKKFLGILTIGTAWFLFAGLLWVHLPHAPVPGPSPKPAPLPALPSLEKENPPSFLVEFERRLKVERLLHTSA